MSEFCSLCQTTETEPYCPRHGVVHRPFGLAGQYELDELIGAGAAAFVFGGRGSTPPADVAVKILRSQVAEGSDRQERFLHQADAAWKLKHENIVGIVDFGRDAVLGVTYLVMERVSGQTAHATVRRSGPLAWGQVVPLLQQICRAVAAAHELGIHDGLTAKNVFLVPGAHALTVKLCDFGFSTGTNRSEPGDDAHGIGTVAYELLTGRAARDATGTPSDGPIRMNERLPALALPNALDDLVWACRLRDPTQRPSLDEIAVALAALAAPGEAPASGPTEAARGDPAEAARGDPAEAARGDPAEATRAPAANGGDPPALPSMIGSYRVVESLGTGGAGYVFLGQHPVIGSKVAIKVLRPEIASWAEAVERFIQEARASSEIASPYIPRYFDFGTTPDGLPYVVMEYLHGETLAARLTRDGPLTIKETAQIVEQVARGLLMAHETGLIHRDLKPDNIFLLSRDPKAGGATPRRATQGSAASPVVESDLQIKVLDFGIAKMVRSPSAPQTNHGYFVGTPSHCAPEQVFGGPVDARTDVYSLGATAFEMLTGAPPFRGEISEVLAAKTSRGAPDVREFRDVPAEVADTIARMLARNPDDRAESMSWVLEQIPSWYRTPSSRSVVPTSDAAAEIVTDPDGGAPTTEPRLEATAVTAAPDQLDHVAAVVDAPRAGIDDAVVAAGVQAGGDTAAMPAPAAAEVGAAEVAERDPTGRDRADVAPHAQAGIERDPASTSQALRAVTQPRGRLRRIGLLLGGCALALIAIIVVGLSRTTGEDSRRQIAPAASRASDAQPERSSAPSPEQPTTSIVNTSAAPAGAPSTTVGSTTDERSPAYQRPVEDKPAADSKPRANTKSPVDKKPSTKKRPTDKPPDKTPDKKEVLIVDPFAN